MPRTKGAYGLKWRHLFTDEPSKTETNKHSYAQYQLRQRMLTQYGMTPVEYARHHTPSHCPICQEPMNPEKRGIHLDHDHTTLEIRGILCRECNIMLGKARDNPYILLAAVAYLNKAKVK